MSSTVATARMEPTARPAQKFRVGLVVVTVFRSSLGSFRPGVSASWLPDIGFS
jgi:hypothetical protein